jgi:hypothetical protein
MGDESGGGLKPTIGPAQSYDTPLIGAGDRPPTQSPLPGRDYGGVAEWFGQRAEKDGSALRAGTVKLPCCLISCWLCRPGRSTQIRPSSSQGLGGRRRAPWFRFAGTATADGAECLRYSLAQGVPICGIFRSEFPYAASPPMYARGSCRTDFPRRALPNTRIGNTRTGPVW